MLGDCNSFSLLFRKGNWLIFQYWDGDNFNLKLTILSSWNLFYYGNVNKPRNICNYLGKSSLFFLTGKCEEKDIKPFHALLFTRKPLNQINWRKGLNPGRVLSLNFLKIDNIRCVIVNPWKSRGEFEFPHGALINFSTQPYSNPHQVSKVRSL